MSLKVPDLGMLETMREEYAQHLANCQALIDTIPEQHRMQRRNAGFHADASVVAALGNSLGHDNIKLLEIGVWKAATLTYFLKKTGPASTAVGLDVFQFENQLLEAKFVIARQDLVARAELLVGPSHSIPKPIFDAGQSFDIVHIDGSHTFMDACRDILIYYHFLKPGGWMVIDDYKDDKHSPEVRTAVDTLVDRNIIRESNKGSLEGWTNYLIQKAS
ncbi:class I SAM-dependent methyltransferase [Rhizobium sp. L1K21]|uniref:class I SAM-dependent methyltransferase n=1 Tax=Rhizobium sp. L1K21 TaxID=2954933 RepID=UPI002093B7F7|nr:class I SAM-dependent methyltransferase [Rhizobium sp. L1K21]MCO6185494.1 class I SAM-dependent methyltransferase [Rhizobium sp. L1K21]